MEQLDQLSIPEKLVNELHRGSGDEVEIIYTENGEVCREKLNSYNVRVVLVPTIVSFRDPYEDREITFDVSLLSLLEIRVTSGGRRSWDPGSRSTLISRWVQSHRRQLLRIPELETQIAELKSKQDRAVAREDYELAVRIKTERSRLEKILGESMK